MFYHISSVIQPKMPSTHREMQHLSHFQVREGGRGRGRGRGRGEGEWEEEREGGGEGEGEREGEGEGEGQGEKGILETKFLLSLQPQ